LKYSEFFRLEIPWKIIRDKLEYDGSAYLALVKNYNNLEWHEDADACYYEYRIIKSRELKGVRKIFDFFLFYFYGYGIRPEYPLAAMAAIFAFSTLVYLLEGQASTTLDAAEISIKALTIQISTDLVGLCKWCSIAERILGWLLMSSFLVVLVPFQVGFYAE
jgi:hypothetical protein